MSYLLQPLAALEAFASQYPTIAAMLLTSLGIIATSEIMGNTYAKERQLNGLAIAALFCFVLLAGSNDAGGLVLALPGAVLGGTRFFRRMNEIDRLHDPWRRK